MDFSDFFKKSFSDFFASSIQCLEEEGSNLEIQIAKSRKDVIKEVFQLLNEDRYNLIRLTGPSGAGKTHLLKTLGHLLDTSIRTYYYECTQATNLDDIILSLFSHLKKITPKDTDYIRTFRVSASLSIDERLVNRLKKLDKPLLIIFDGIENFYDTEDADKKQEFTKFLNFVLSVPAIKVILSGEQLPQEEEDQKVCNIQISGLDEKEAFELIKNTGIADSEEVIENIFKITYGYPENVLLFASFAEKAGLKASILVEKIKISGLGFNKFMEERLYQLVPEDHIELLNFFSLARHSFSAETIQKVGFDSDVKEKLRNLNTLMILDENNGSYQVKQRFRDFLESRIPINDRIEIHSRLHEIYSDQISAKLEDRILPVSRSVLYSEQLYHFTTLNRIIETEPQHLKVIEGIETDEFTPKNEDFSIDVSHSDNTDEEKEFLDTFSDEDMPEVILSEEETALIKEKTEEKSVLQEITEEELVKALALAEEKNNEQECLMAHYRLGNLYKEHYRHDQALKNYYAVLNFKLDDVPGNIISDSLEGIGEIYDYRKDFVASRSFYLKAINEAEKLGNDKQKARIYFKQALAYDDAGDYDSAIEFYQKNIEVSEDIETNPFLAAAYSNTAAIYEEQGHPIMSIEFYKKSLEFDIKSDNLEGQYEVLSNLGNIYFETENYSESGKYFYKALKIAKEIDDPYKIAMSYIDMGDIFLFEKNYEKAIKSFIFAKKSIDKTISTDSKEKINRRFRQVIAEIGRKKYNEILDKIKAKHV